MKRLHERKKCEKLRNQSIFQKKIMIKEQSQSLKKKVELDLRNEYCALVHMPSHHSDAIIEKFIS